MSASEFHEALHDITRLFEQLALQLEQGIETLAANAAGEADLAALQRARVATHSAANRMRDVTPDLLALRDEAPACDGAALHRITLG